MHAMGLYLLGEGFHEIIDKYRARFFWEANGPKHKYHRVILATVCRTKDLGGLGSQIPGSKIFVSW
jgi:hypothetical protein